MSGDRGAEALERFDDAGRVLGTRADQDVQIAGRAGKAMSRQRVGTDDHELRLDLEHGSRGQVLERLWLADPAEGIANVAAKDNAVETGVEADPVAGR